MVGYFAPYGGLFPFLPIVGGGGGIRRLWRSTRGEGALFRHHRLHLNGVSE